MDKFENNIHLSEGRSSWGSAILILGLALAGSLIGSYIGLLLSIPFYEGTIIEMAEAFANPMNNPQIKLPLFISQGVTTLLGMIIVPALYLKVRENKSLAIFFKNPLGWVPLLACVIIVISFMVVNSIFIEWNANVSFPDFMKGFEEWARGKEDKLAEVTIYLTNFESTTDLIVAFIVIAVLAPVGEELLFRGFLQNEFHRGSGNIHVAIWLSAILFSAIHIQFFGFVPRLLLGALFGYLYYWSGNLWIPILAHFVNNGFTLVMLYLHQKEVVTYDLENTEAVPLSTVLIFIIITAGLLYYFRYYFLNASTDERMAKGI
ncbi:abortive infection protein family [Fulvivirga imtechensis AK7]|uniref:Abortive infection protein family n=1 Tax=Fulvivirga imtechensis AK7 TaxID=1237149 RepID=L8JT91_9BACT|nr:CPBP family intramembrane glutamic endopeptidase [Fulvivirga imtechensis]ELR71438.1 abortive infection protein family [Fulvivirga imtechensis AK7]